MLIRADIQGLTSTIGRITGKQLNRAQDKAVASAYEAEETITKACGNASGSVFERGRIPTVLQ